MLPLRVSRVIDCGWWSGAERLLSPNFNDRPDGCAVDLLVIHNISLPPGCYGGGHVEQFFLNQLDASLDPYFESIAQLRVSAHILIERSGRTVQFVPFNKRAWHAGRSQFQGRDECNDFSIGIELEGCDDQAYTEDQYTRLVELSAVIMNTYTGISLDRIVGHSDIAPDRKTDPGPAFDWRLYRSLLTKYLDGEA